MKFIKVGISCLFAFGLAFTSFAQAQTSASANGFTPNQVKQIQRIIHNYILKNPNILVKASEELQKQATEQAQQQAMQAITANRKGLFLDKNNPTAGNRNGRVVLVEFFDYQCGHCKAMGRIIEKLIKKNKNLKVIFKELPIFGANSRYAAMVALAANKQGKYFRLHNALLGTADPLTKQKTLAIARKSGVNMRALTTDLKSAEIRDQIRMNFTLAKALRLMGTPAFIISNRKGSGNSVNDYTKFRFIPGATSESNMQAAINAVE